MPVTNASPAGTHASHGKQPCTISEHLSSEIALYYSTSSTNIVRCQYRQLEQHMRDHGLTIGNRSLLQARNILTFHMVYGMCVSRAGEKCKLIADGLNQCQAANGVLNQITHLCRESLMTLNDLRFVCNAAGFKLPIATDVDGFLHAIHSAIDTINDMCFDILDFFCSLEKASRPTLFRWCSIHGIYPDGSSSDITKQLMKHIIRLDCRATHTSLFKGCHDVSIQDCCSFADANKGAFLPSVACLSTDVSKTTLSLIVQLLSGDSCTGLSLTMLQQKLRSLIFRMRRGKAIYHTVVRQTRYGKTLTRLHRIRNTWPVVADASLKNKIKSLFEDEVKKMCNVQQVCASCSAKFGEIQFISVSPADVDFSLLQNERDESIPSHAAGPLANLLLDPLGLDDNTENDVNVTLCHDCHNSLSHHRMPKFALANHLNLGEIPDELRGLSAVEESMVALCRSRCIMVQLQSVRGAGNSQRGYKGHTIFHQQDTGKMATLLPPPIEDILTPICVLFIGSTKPSVKWIRDHAKPLVVRANVVRRALIWLKENNPLYASVHVNHDVLNSIEQLGGLPYHVEYANDADISTACVSSYAPGDNHDDTPLETRCPEIPFENVIIADLEDAATPNDMRAAALRHLKKGKAFLMYGHSATPESEYHNPKLFPSLYPTLFPFGEGGFDDNRRHPHISMNALARHFLNIADGRFREHPSFIFSVFNVLQRREVIQRTSMRVSRSSFESKAEIYARLQPEAIQRVAEQMEKGEMKFDRQDEKDVLHLMRDVHMVNSTVMGSGASRMKMRNEIRAMIASLGAPSFFITINPADVYNPLVKLLAGDEIDIDKLLPEQIPNYMEQSILIAKDPVLAARFFHIYMKAFFSAILLVDPRHKNLLSPSILGATKGYYGTVEAQGRGSLHCHMLIWLEGGLGPSEIRNRILADPDGLFAQSLISYIEENICTEIPDDPGDISHVPSSVHHPCSVRPVCQMVAEPSENYNLRRRKDLVNLSSQCQRHVHNATCYKNTVGSDKKCRFNLDDAKKIEQTTFDTTTGEINFQCLDGMVNQYNMTMLEILRCNMDIKFIGSGYSALAVLYYITDYISKTQLKTHTAYNALEMALQRLNEFGRTDESDSVRGRKILLKCANAIISKQELSAQQVASYLLDNDDHYSSHRFKEIYWQSYEAYVLHCLENDAGHGADTMEIDDSTTPLQQNAPPAPDSDNLHDAASSTGDDLLRDPLVLCKEFVSVSVNKHGLLVPNANHVAHYVYRPAEMNMFCLWDFLSCADVTRGTMASSSESDDETTSSEEFSENSSEPHDPQHPYATVSSSSFTEAMYRGTLCSSKLRFKTSHPSYKTHVVQILKPHQMYTLVPTGPPIPRRDREENHESYCRLMLILFKPWTTPADLKPANLSWADAFDQFTQSEDILYEHMEIVNNLQFLHECRDSRDHDAAKRRISREMPRGNGDNISIIDTDLSANANEDALHELEEQHDELLRDVLRLRSVNDTNIAECLNALSLSHLSSHIRSSTDSLVTADRDLNNLVNFTEATDVAQIGLWKAYYTARRKSAKLTLQEEGTTTRPLNHALHPSITGLDNLNLHLDASNSSNSPISSENANIENPARMPVTLESLSSVISNHWTLNVDQKRAFNIVANHATDTNSTAPLTMILSGPAGSGKSQVINALRHFFHARHEKRRFRVASFMGIAANNVSGLTLHAALNISNNNARRANDSSATEELMYMWSGVDYLFIDEVSMISCEFLFKISEILCRATGRKEPFGGISVIFAGDLAQLPPVAETRLHAYVNPSHLAATDRGQQRLKGKLLWLSISTVVVLHRINRQSGAENARFVELLNRLRLGECNASDFHLLQNRIVSATLNVSQWNLPLSNIVPVIVTDNTTKDAINSDLAAAFAARTGQTLHNYWAVDSMNGATITDPALLQIIDLLHSGKTSGRLKRLPLVIGMPVMVTTNIDVNGGIVNGSIGTIRSIHFTYLPGGERAISHCIVHIPTAQAPQMSGLGPHEYPILADTVSVTFRGTNSKQTLSFRRTQVPLIPAFAMTAHKSQGQTLNKAVVDLASCHGTEAPYVMISRVRRLEDLLILRPFPIARIKCRMSEDSRREQDRLQYHNLATTIDYGDPEEQPTATVALQNWRKKYSDRELNTLLGAYVTATTSDDHDEHRQKRRRTTR